jgi:hypothetical protein
MVRPSSSESPDALVGAPGGTQPDRRRALAGEEPRPAARDHPARRQKNHQCRRRHALPPPARAGYADLRDHPHRLARHRHGRHHGREDSLSAHPAPRSPGPREHLDGRGQHRAEGPHRRHRRRLPGAGLRLRRHQGLRPPHRLPLAVLPHGADEEPPGRDHRRPPAHQRPGPENRGHHRVQRDRPAPRRVARLAGGGRPHQPAAHRPVGNALRVLRRPPQQGDRREVTLHRRALPPRPRAHDDARRGRARHGERSARGVAPDRPRPLRAQDRRAPP